MPVAKINNVQMDFQVYGNGVPIVFIPPPVVGSVVFQEQTRDLSRDYQVILFELRGHGESQASDEPYTYSIMADDIRALLDYLGIEQAVICGYSMGGSAALEFMRRYPGRTKACIPLSGFSEVSHFRLRTEITAAVKVMGVRALRTLSCVLAAANADSFRSFRQMYRFGLTCNVQDVKSLFAYALTFNCTADLRQMSTPMRLIFGDKDKRIYHYINIFKKQLKHPDIIVMKGASHQLPLKYATELNQLLRDFLQRVSQ